VVALHDAAGSDAVAAMPHPPLLQSRVLGRRGCGPASLDRVTSSARSSDRICALSVLGTLAGSPRGNLRSIGCRPELPGCPPARERWPAGASKGLLGPCSRRHGRLQQSLASRFTCRRARSFVTPLGSRRPPAGVWSELPWCRAVKPWSDGTDQGLEELRRDQAGCRLVATRRERRTRLDRSVNRRVRCPRCHSVKPRFSRRSPSVGLTLAPTTSLVIR
jgi:hypothetical protein